MSNLFDRVDLAARKTHLLVMPKREQTEIEFLKTWTLPPAATLGSDMRAKGLLLEMRARLPLSSRKLLVLEGVELVLAMPATAKTEFTAAVGIISAGMKDIESLPVNRVALPQGTFVRR